MGTIRAFFVLILGACTVTVWGKTFQMARRGDAVVKVDKVGGVYKVTCVFSPQTKFDDAINAKFNDARGDSLCKRGLARYLNVGTNDLFSVSGLHVLAPVKRDGDKLHYSFAVPVDGCKVEAGAAKPKVAPKPVDPGTPAATNGAPVAVPAAKVEISEKQ